MPPCGERHRGYAVGLKPTRGGSIPSFLTIWRQYMRVLQMYGREEDIRRVTQGSWWSTLLGGLLVWP